MFNSKTCNIMASTAFSLAKAIVAVHSKQERFQSILLGPSVSDSRGIRICSSIKQVEKQSQKRQANCKLVMMMTMENKTFRNKPRILCIHSFRTSAAIFQKMIERWPVTVLEKLQLHFLDGPFLARGKSDVELLFDPPYYEWYQSSEDFKVYEDFEECVAYIEEYMLKYGPFDGLLGFSQGAFITAAVPGMQAQGVAFTKVPKIRFLIVISGAKFGGYKFGQPKLAGSAYSSPIDCPSLHIIGEKDFMKPGGIDLLGSFVDPVVIHHPKGHIIPRLDDISLKTMLSFIEKMELRPSL
eukprot:XP_002534315.2 esterase OVCA2 isoform X1 [Ricinus communis]